MLGMLRHKLISMTAPSERAVTLCTIGNAYGGLPFELDFSDGPFSSVAAARLSPLTRRGTRVIGADGVSFPSDIARAE